MTKETEEILREGDALERLIQHDGWPILMHKLKERDETLINKGSLVIHDLNQINFDNGQRRGMKEPLSIVQKAIKLRDAELARENSAGGQNARE